MRLKKSEGYERLRSAQRSASRTVDRVTGAEFRRKFEDFTSVISTTVLGVHQDQSKINDRMDKLEEELSRRKHISITTFHFAESRVLAAAVIGLSTAALTVAVVALAIAP